MKILETYILGRIARMFLVTLVPVLAVIWTIQVLGRINLVTDSGQSIGSFFMLATLILPTILPIVIPFAIVIGVAQTLTAMNNDSELTIIDAAGASPSTIIRPVIVLAALLSVVSFLVDNVVEPKVRVAARQMVAAVYADLLSSVIEEKTFRRIEDGLYVQISERVQGRILQGLFVADNRDPAFELLYYAREGAVNEKGTTLIMEDGEVHRKTLDGNVSVIRFDSYAFDLGELAQSRGQANLRAIDRDLPFLFNPDPDDANVKAKPLEYTAELHRRLTEWSFPLLYALVTLVIAGNARSHREARLHPVIASLAIAFALRWASFYLGNRLEKSTELLPLLYGLPLATAILAILLLSRSRRLEVKAAVATLVPDLAGRFAFRWLNRDRGEGT